MLLFYFKLIYQRYSKPKHIKSLLLFTCQVKFCCDPKYKTHPEIRYHYMSCIPGLTSACFYSDKLCHHLHTIQALSPFVSLFLSWEDVYSHFIFSRCSESSVIKSPHTETTTRARITVKILWKAFGLNRPHKLLLLLLSNSTPILSICSLGLVFWSTLWIEGIKSM